MQNASVAILMATYNGEKYIREQLDSLVNQTYKDFVVYVRDDGSTDQTVYALTEYAERDILPEKTSITSGKLAIQIVTDAEDAFPGRHGARENFTSLYQWVKKYKKHEYYMFCDQDDVWLPEKIEKTLKAMQEVEEEMLNCNGGPDKDETPVEKSNPIMVHTDLRVVDENLSSIGDSYIAYRSLDPSLQDLPHLLAQNNITGCTMMWNQSFMEMVDLDIEGSYLHDWWMSLSASVLGRIVYIPEATILYRQHGDNEVGATKVNSLGYIRQRSKQLDRVHRTINGSMVQAEALLEHYDKYLTDEQKKVLKTYADLLHASKVTKLRTIRKGHYEKQGKIQKIAQKVFI